MKIQLLQIITLLFVLGCTSNKPVFILNNKGVEAQVMQLKNSQLAYLIKKDGLIVIDTSLLGIIVNKKTLGHSYNVQIPLK
jgi:alpha-glucosidase